MYESKLRRRRRKKLSKIRKKVTFHCEICKKKVFFPITSQTLKSYQRGDISHYEAVRRLKLTHFRHKHTQYDSLLSGIFKNVLQQENWDLRKARYDAKALSRSIIRKEVRKIGDENRRRKKLKSAAKEI